MDSEQAIKQIRAYLIGDLTPKEEANLEGHIDVNEEAQWYHQRHYRQLLPVLRQPEHQPSEDVRKALFADARRVIASGELESASTKLQFIEGLRRYGKLSAAAIVIIGAMTGYFWLGRPSAPAPGMGVISWVEASGNPRRAKLAAGETISTGDNSSYVIALAGTGNVPASTLQLGPRTTLKLTHRAAPKHAPVKADGKKHRPEEPTAPTLVIEIERGNVLIDAPRFDERSPDSYGAVEVLAGGRTAALDLMGTENAVVGIEYRAPHSSVKRRGPVVDVDFERVQLSKVVALGSEFDVKVEADENHAGMYVDLYRRDMDRAGYMAALDQIARSLGRTVVAGDDKVHRFAAGEGGTFVETDKAHERDLYSVMLFNGIVKVAGEGWAMPERHVHAQHDPEAYVSMSGSYPQLLAGEQKRSKAFDVIKDFVLNTDLHFDQASPDVISRVNKALNGGVSKITRRQIGVRQAYADDKGRLWVQLNGGTQLKGHARGERIELDGVQGSLVWANRSGALLKTDGGHVQVHFVQP